MHHKQCEQTLMWYWVLEHGFNHSVFYEESVRMAFSSTVHHNNVLAPHLIGYKDAWNINGEVRCP